MITPEEPAAVTSPPQPDDPLLEEVRRAERDLREWLQEVHAVHERTAEARERSGRAIVAMHQQGKSWAEIARLTGLSRTTLLRRAQPYLEEKQP